MFADAAGDEIFHASEVPEHAPVRPRHPVQEAREDVIQLETGKGWRGLKEHAGCVFGETWWW